MSAVCNAFCGLNVFGGPFSMDYISDPLPSVVSRPEKLRNGLAWYAAVLPGMGLFLERFALNKYLGFLVWGLILIVRPLCCLADIRMLNKRGIMSCSGWFALVPTVYLFKRCLKLRQNTAIAVVCLICLSYGIIGNGFVSGMFVDDERIMNAVRNESITSVTELKGEKVGGSLAEALESSLDRPEWTVTANGDVRTVTVSGKTKSGGEQVSLVFKVTHDGYTYTEFKLEKVLRDNSELEGDDRKELLKALLISNPDG